MLTTLLDISEAETGVMRLDIKSVKVSELIERVVDLYGCVAEEKEIKLTSSCPENLTIAADSLRLGRVLANLVDNALKYTPSGGNVQIEAEGLQKQVRISVKDNGIGIEKTELTRIWDRLYRCDKSRSEKGLGLGLSLVKAVVEAHRGTIEVESVPGKGSIFKVTLPVFLPGPGGG
jgi:signal transduction histidine kinase